MEKQNFQLTCKVNASAKEAMQKISQVNKWWAKNYNGKSEKLNDTFSVHFGDTFVDFKISELISNQKVVWQVTNCNLHWIKAKKEWNGTEVVFELDEKAKTTNIHFTHIGLAPGCECYNDCEVGWTGHLKNSLVKLINEGKGMPE